MICTVCGGRNYDVVAHKLRFDIPRRVVKCQRCDLVSLEDPSTDAFDYATQYDRSHGPVLGHESTPEELFEIYLPAQPDRVHRVEHLLSRDRNVLEVGCSTGYFLHSLEGRVGRRVGLELNPKRAAYARERCGIEVYEAPLEEVTLSREYDLIFAFQVFEHLVNPLSFLERCRTLLRPEGRLYIEVPNIEEALVHLYQVGPYQAFNYRAPHVYYYSRATLERLMKVAGFEGRTRYFQEFSLFNHMHWLSSGTPQRDFSTAYGLPEWEESPWMTRVSTELRAWLHNVDKQYKGHLERWGLSDNLSFEGSPQPGGRGQSWVRR